MGVRMTRAPPEKTGMAPLPPAGSRAALCQTLVDAFAARFPLNVTPFWGKDDTC